MMQELTQRERQVFDVLCTLTAENRMPPTLAEMSAEMDRNRVTIHAHLNSLARKGWVKRASRRGWRKWSPSNSTPDDLVRWAQRAIKVMASSGLVWTGICGEGRDILRGMGVRDV